MNIEEAVSRAADMGLDGICITDHDSLGHNRKAGIIGMDYGILVFTGVEILTFEGDLLCFGLSEVPRRMLHACELTELVNGRGGVSIAAHPFRQNGRGIADRMFDTPGLGAVEAYNGNTIHLLNARAHAASLRLGLPATGGSDAHSRERVGIFATMFPFQVASEPELIEAIRNGSGSPVAFDKESGSYILCCG